MNLYQCSKCNVQIHSNTTSYRGFDNTYCSKQCLEQICYEMDILDEERVHKKRVYLEYQKSVEWTSSELNHFINIPTEEILTEEIPKEKIPTEKIPTEEILNLNSNNYYNKVNIYKIPSYIYILASSVGAFGFKTILSINYPISQYGLSGILM